MKKESFLWGEENAEPGGVVPVGFAGEDGNSIKAAIAAKKKSQKSSMARVRVTQKGTSFGV
jgi:hypothetical protein